MIKRLTYILIAILIVTFVGGCSLGKKGENNVSSDPNKVVIAASIFPIADIAQNVVGDTGVVFTVLPAGASPHTYEPRISDIKNLSDARVLFTIGHGLDEYVHDIEDNISGIEVVTVDANLDLLAFGDEEEGHDHDDGEDSHDHGPVDPHYWLSADNAQIIAQTIADELKKVYPQYSRTFELNAVKYKNDLVGLNNDIIERLESVKDKPVITLHDGWNYFANEYGIDVIGTFEPEPGKEPGPRYLQELQEAIDEHGVKVVFSEPQLSKDVLKALSNDLNIEIIELDPIGGLEGRMSYIDLMKYNALAIYNALK